MSLFKRINRRAVSRKFRVRNKIARTSSRSHKVVVLRTNKHIYASLVEFSTGKTICGYSSHNVDNKVGALFSRNNKEVASEVGVALGKMCLEKGVTLVAFDRGACLYHGKIEALANGLRSVGVGL